MKGKESKSEMKQKKHQHGPGCGHTAIKHKDHIDYLVDGSLTHVENGKTVKHVIEVSDANPSQCRTVDCEGHSGAKQVPHGDHLDFLINGKLHHKHKDHCDDHGSIALA